MNTKTFFALFASAAVAGCCAPKCPQAECQREKNCQEKNCKVECPQAYPETVNEGFVSLFNGVDLEGWTGATGMYGVDPKEPGVLQCFPERQVKGQPGNLITKKQYGNFILRFEFMMPENGNNGLGIRTTDVNKDAAYHGMCELQLLDDGGSAYYDSVNKKDLLKPYQYTGSVYGIFPSRRDNVNKQIWGKDKKFTGGGSYVRTPGMWNFVEVKVIGSESPILDSEVPVRQILEQLIAKTGLPPFLLGLSWSTTERMSAQQADLLTSELWALRRAVEPVIRKICRTWLILEGYDPAVEIVWDEISLQDLAETARAELYRAQAAKLKVEN